VLIDPALQATQTAHAALPPLPTDERERLEELLSYAILDTAPEAAFDDIAELATMICGMPMALVSLVDDHRQWFKARVGLTASQTPRSIAFCDHAIRQEQPLVVCDAAADPRFAANPLVTGSPGLRFYAGAQLTSPAGHRLGTLCVLDDKPYAEGLSDAPR
jgi:GAF domain-containing protein